MELRARIRHFARPAAFTVALTALLVPAVAGPATADAAKRKKKRYPVVTSVSPMSAKVGDTIVIRGRNFKRGKNKNTVVFKRDGARAVFQKSTLATARQIRVVVPDSVRAFLPDNTTARFRLRVLSERFSKSFTSKGKSPSITALPKPLAGGGGTTVNGGTIVTPTPPTTTPNAGKVCKADEDDDMLTASLENQLGLDPCNPDTDGDGVSDGYEYKSALDLNDDEYQQTNQNLPYPGKRPYPNPLFKDADVDYDGDGLPQLAEFKLWTKYGSRPAGGVLSANNYAFQLLYSDGEQYSLSTRDGSGRRVPSQPAATYTKANQFLGWAAAKGYDPVMISKPNHVQQWFDDAVRDSYSIRDVNLDHSVSAKEASLADHDKDGYISDDERDEDADGLSNFDELRSAMQPGYWEQCYKAIDETPYPVKYDGTDLTDPDTDGDGIRDGADDQDHDDIPNVMELSRWAAAGYSLSFVDWHKKTCSVDNTLKNGPDVDGDGSPDWVIKHPDDAPVAPNDEPTPQYGRVNPFNPCLPFAYSRTCAHNFTLGTEFTPFDTSPWYALQ